MGIIITNTIAATNSDDDDGDDGGDDGDGGLGGGGGGNDIRTNCARTLVLGHINFQ